ncbi:MAG: glycosyltransferase family 39 protein [Desulfovibrio sp.]|nr:glycosyltransferase family 39 protein [Desulfovibrio sp.]
MLPDYGTLNLYSLLLSPLVALPGNLFLWVRLFDLVVAVLMAALFYRCVERESGESSLTPFLCLLCLLCMNAADCIDGGCKNSFFLAYLPLFGALLLSDQKTTVAFFGAGVLTALGVLVREPFAIYAVVGVFAVFLGHGLKKAFWYCLGGIMTGICVIGIVACFRGGIAGLAAAYLRSGSIIGAESGHVLTNALRGGWRCFVDFWPFLVVSVAGIVWSFRSKVELPRKKVYFWIALIVAPLPEIFGKISFLYHYSMMFPAIAGLDALCLAASGKKVEQKRHKGEQLSCVLVIVLLVITVPSWEIVETVKLYQTYPTLTWSKDEKEQSNTLIAADHILRLGGTSLSVSGFMHFLYPATRKLPPKPGMDDLSRFFIFHALNHAETLSDLVKNSPDIVAIGYTSPFENHVVMFTEDLRMILDHSGLYTLAAYVPLDETKDYGWIGCYIYRRK